MQLPSVISFPTVNTVITVNLFIQSPGTYVHVHDQMFQIRLKKEGEVVKRDFAPQKITAILMQTGVAISTDAIALALQHNVDIQVVNFDGHPLGRFWHSKLGSTTRIRKCQLEASLSSQGLEWVRAWLVAKLDNQSDFIRELTKHREGKKEALLALAGRIDEMRAKIHSVEADRVDLIADTLRGWEGNAGKAYFEALGIAIPDRFAFSGRSTRPAKDPFNAMLNYAYGVLYGKVEKALMIAGADPFVGFLHRDDYNQKSLVFDFIEPYRIHAERVVFRLFSGKQVNDSHFESLSGGIRLGAEGKPVLVEKLFDYLDIDKIRHRGRNLSRLHAMQLDAHAFAQDLLGKNTEDIHLPDQLLL